MELRSGRGGFENGVVFSITHPSLPDRKHGVHASRVEVGFVASDPIIPPCGVQSCPPLKLRLDSSLLSSEYFDQHRNKTPVP